MAPDQQTEGLKQLRSPPFEVVDGIHNFRDAGGYATSPSGSVRRGLLYRCANPTDVTPSGLDRLRELGIRRVFDLRSEPEVMKGSQAEGQGQATDGETIKSPFVTRSASSDTYKSAVQIKDTDIERVWCPVFKAVDYTSGSTLTRYKALSHLSTAQAIAHGYVDIFEQGTDAYRTVLEHLASPDSSPCIIHCTAGKDRTGALTALVLLLCGVEANVIADEYALTTSGLAPMLGIYKTRLMGLPGFEGDDKERIVDIVLSSERESMLAVIDMVQTQYGGAEAYVKDVIGLSDAQIAALRSNFATKEKAVL